MMEAVYQWNTGEVIVFKKENMTLCMRVQEAGGALIGFKLYRGTTPTDYTEWYAWVIDP